jgi:uncharacterized protein (DUF433 family)
MKLQNLKDVVRPDPENMGGTSIFVGRRVPLQNLMIDALEGGDSIDDSFEGFPNVKRSQPIAAIGAGQLNML